MLRMESAIAAHDEPAYRAAVDAILAATEARAELLVRLSDSLDREQQEGRVWPGKTFPSAEVLLRCGRAGVRPLLQTVSAAVAHEVLDLGGMPDRDMLMPWTFDHEQEAELLDIVLSRVEDLADRVTAAMMLGAFARSWAPPTLRALLAFCERDDVTTGDEAHVGPCVVRALICHADRDLDGFLAALAQTPACGKICALSFLADAAFVRAARVNPALLRTVDGFLTDPDPRVIAHAAVTSAALGGDRARARALLEAGLAHRESDIRAAATDALADWPENVEWVEETLLRLQWSENDRALAKTAHAALVRRGARFPTPTAVEASK